MKPNKKAVDLLVKSLKAARAGELQTVIVVSSNERLTKRGIDRATHQLLDALTASESPFIESKVETSEVIGRANSTDGGATRTREPLEGLAY